MKNLLFCFVVLLSGCSLMPSKWDENQARVITNIRQEAQVFDCNKPLEPQLAEMSKDLQWFQLYSDFRGANDINKMVSTVNVTIVEMSTRVTAGPVSKPYCELKRGLIIEQVDIIGHTIEGSLP